VLSQPEALTQRKRLDWNPRKSLPKQSQLVRIGTTGGTGLQVPPQSDLGPCFEPIVQILSYVSGDIAADPKTGKLADPMVMHEEPLVFMSPLDRPFLTGSHSARWQVFLPPRGKLEAQAGALLSIRGRLEELCQNQAD